MNYLLDTCVLSELFKPWREPAVALWMERQHDESLFLSVITLGEIQKGISKLPPSKKTTLLGKQFSSFLSVFADRVIPLDQDVLLRWGVLCGKSELRGESLPVMDSLIAATAQAKGFKVVTRNVRDMERCGADVVNPWEA